MNKESPLSKKQKLSSSCYEEDRAKVHQDVHCRKLAINSIQEYYLLQLQRIQPETFIKNIKLPEKNSTYTTPDIDKTLQTQHKDLTKEIEEANSKIYNFMILLDILEQKEKCPISKIIDEI